MDPLSPDERSAFMAKIRGKDTKPEKAIRSLLHAAGYRFRVHAKHLPGRPDIAFTGRRKVIFVHGCFWHQHEACKRSHIPKTRADYWRTKFAKNRERDRRNEQRLKELGWAVTVVWECELEGEPDDLLSRLGQFLGPPRNRAW